MAANELSFNQVATVLNEIQKMVTGHPDANIVTEGDFSTVATTVLKSGYEKVYNAISTVLGRTIFSIRPYTRKFKGMERTSGEFTMHERKLSIVDNEFEDNQTTKWPVQYDSTQQTNPYGNGESVDQQKIKKHEFLQTNFYGMNTYQDHYTIFDEQLEIAFKNSAELGRFIQMITMNVNNMFEQAREDFARMNLVNYIAAEITNNRYIDLLSVYNIETDESLTVSNYKNPQYYAPFMRWAFAYIKSVSQMFTERTTLYQSIINNKVINRHVPIEDQRLFVYAPEMYGIEANVLSTTFHEEYLKKTYTEKVNFWQTPDTPSAIAFKPVFTGNNGQVTIANDAIDTRGKCAIFAVLFDKEALGYTITKSTMKAAPYNAAADYQNFFLKDYHKNYMDITEKGVVFTIGAPIDDH